jgi:hypothetical protein
MVWISMGDEFYNTIKYMLASRLRRKSLVAGLYCVSGVPALDMNMLIYNNSNAWQVQVSYFPNDKPNVTYPTVYNNTEISMTM